MPEKGLISKSILTGIANAIRAKTGGTDTMTPAEMAANIAAISAGSALANVEKAECVVATFASTGETTIAHSMGVTPDVVLLINKDYAVKDGTWSKDNADEGQLELLGVSPRTPIKVSGNGDYVRNPQFYIDYGGNGTFTQSWSYRNNNMAYVTDESVIIKLHLYSAQHPTYYVLLARFGRGDEA